MIDCMIIPATDGEKMYAVLETESLEIIHLWITPIINEEVKKYDLSQDNVYIKPLG